MTNRQRCQNSQQSLAWNEFDTKGEAIVCSQTYDAASQTTVVTKHGAKHSCIVTYHPCGFISVDHY